MPSRASPRPSRARRATLEHVIFAGFSHEPAVRAGREAAGLAPREAGRAPLAQGVLRRQRLGRRRSRAEDGFHWFRNRGEHAAHASSSRCDNGYHGETLGALSVGDIPLYRRVYAPLLLKPLFAPSPDAYAAEPGETRRRMRAARAPTSLRAMLRAPRRRNLRADPGAAGAVRRRHAHARPGLPAARARAVRCARRVPDRRRDRGRLRPHRHDVRLRAGAASARTCCACRRA